MKWSLRQGIECHSENTVINIVFLVHINLPEQSRQQSVHAVMLISTWVIGGNYVTSVNSQFYIHLWSSPHNAVENIINENDFWSRKFICKKMQISLVKKTVKKTNNANSSLKVRFSAYLNLPLFSYFPCCIIFSKTPPCFLLCSCCILPLMLFAVDADFK